MQKLIYFIKLMCGLTNLILITLIRKYDLKLSDNP